MTKVISDISMALDGYVTAPNVCTEAPLGDGGQRLHAWAFGGGARASVVVVTHRAPDAAPAGGVSRFVTGGIGRALAAKAAPGDGGVAVMGGADVGRQVLRAGPVDEHSLHLVPVLFGGGTRLSERPGGGHLRLETARVIDPPAAVHRRFRVRGREP